VWRRRPGRSPAPGRGRRRRRREAPCRPRRRRKGRRRSRRRAPAARRRRSRAPRARPRGRGRARSAVSVSTGRPSCSTVMVTGAVPRRRRAQPATAPATTASTPPTIRCRIRANPCRRQGRAAPRASAGPRLDLPYGRRRDGSSPTRERRECEATVARRGVLLLAGEAVPVPVRRSDEVKARMTGETPHGRAIAVIGLGYVGLPVAVAFAKAGAPVVGFDVDAGRIGELSAGRDRTREIDPADLAVAPRALHRGPGGPEGGGLLHRHRADAHRRRQPAGPVDGGRRLAHRRRGAHARRHRRLRIDRLSGRHRGGLRAGAGGPPRASPAGATSPSATRPSASTRATAPAASRR
jgi:hypothetical protein